MESHTYVCVKIYSREYLHIHIRLINDQRVHVYIQIARPVLTLLNIPFHQRNIKHQTVEISSQSSDLFSPAFSHSFMRTCVCMNDSVQISPCNAVSKQKTFLHYDGNTYPEDSLCHIWLMLAGVLGIKAATESSGSFIWRKIFLC